MCSGRSALRSTGSCAGASPTTTWTFVPLNPNELTPPTRGVSPAAQGLNDVTTSTGSVGHGM